MCDRFGDCSNDGTCQLVLRNRQTGMERVEHHCKAHLVLRIWEVERDERFEIVDARTLDRSIGQPQEDPPAEDCATESRDSFEVAGIDESGRH